MVPAHPWHPQGPGPPLWLPPLPLQALVPFHNLGVLTGLFSPRCADLWPATRQEAVSCVYALLYLHLGYEGEPWPGRGAGGLRGRGWALGAGEVPAQLHSASCL